MAGLVPAISFREAWRAESSLGSIRERRYIASTQSGKRVGNMPALMGGGGRLLRIKVLRGGAVSEIAAFLTDLEGAYNALYAFEWTVSRWQRRRRFFPHFSR